MKIKRVGSYPETPYISWLHNGIEQVIAFANADDAKICYQALVNNGVPAGFTIPEKYKEIPMKRFERDGLLSEAELAVLTKKVASMKLVTR